MTTMKMKMKMMMMMLTMLFPAAGSLHPGASSLHCHRVHVQVCFPFHQGFRSGLCQHHSINNGDVNDCKYSVNYQQTWNDIFSGETSSTTLDKQIGELQMSSRWSFHCHFGQNSSIHWIGRIISLVYFPAGWCLNILLYEDV